MFDLIVISGSALTGAFGPAMLVLIFNVPTSPPAIKTSMITGLSVAIAWRAFGMSEFMIEALPALVAGILAQMLVVAVTSSTRQRRV